MLIHRSSSADTATVLKLNGHLNFDGRTSFHKSIKDARTAGATSITLNMENVSDIDSAGLALLRNAYEELSVIERSGYFIQSQSSTRRGS